MLVNPANHLSTRIVLLLVKNWVVSNSISMKPSPSLPGKNTQIVFCNDLTSQLHHVGFQMKIHKKCSSAEHSTNCMVVLACSWRLFCRWLFSVFQDEVVDFTPRKNYHQMLLFSNCRMFPIPTPGLPSAFWDLVKTLCFKDLSGLELFAASALLFISSNRHSPHLPRERRGIVTWDVRICSKGHQAAGGCSPFISNSPDCPARSSLAANPRGMSGIKASSWGFQLTWISNPHSLGNC